MSTGPKSPAANTQFNIRLPAELKDRLANYAQLVGRPQASVASDALADYLAWRIPQIEALHKAMAAADDGDFASADEVEAFFKPYEA
jgi:predicted transcriptional regulator